MVRFTVDNRNRLIFYGNPVGYVKEDTLAEYVERIFAEHFEGGNDMQTERTLAVKISAELFDRLKEYLEKNHLKQKDFITQLIQQALDNAEE